MRVWQVLVANQILAKTITCQIVGTTDFGGKPIRPLVHALFYAIFVHVTISNVTKIFPMYGSRQVVVLYISSAFNYAI